MKKLRNRRGQGMSEYLIILALVAIATIGAVIFFADNVKEQIQTVAEVVAGDNTAADTGAIVGTRDDTSRNLSDYIDAATANAP
ncbi:MAG: hypothetical protein AB1640_11270 [bacterium]